MYIVKHWKGELSLPVSYWINGVLLGWFIAFGATWFTNNAEVVLAPYLKWPAIQGLFVLQLILVVAIAIWMGVGIWRSAGNSMKAGRYTWPAIARFLVLVQGALFFYNIWAGYTGSSGVIHPQEVAMNVITRPSVESLVQVSAENLKAELPLKLDEVTTFTDVKAENRSLHFYYTISPSSYFQQLDWDRYRNIVVENICGSVPDVNLLRRGATYQFWHTDGLLPHQNRFTLSEMDCVCTKVDGLGDCVEAKPATP